MKEINVILGEKVKTARWKKEMTRETLAEKVSVSPRFLADVESGKIGVSIQTLKSLAITLETSADYLLGLEPAASDECLLARAFSSLDKKYLPLVSSFLAELQKLS